MHCWQHLLSSQKQGHLTPLLRHSLWLFKAAGALSHRYYAERGSLVSRQRLVPIWQLVKLYNRRCLCSQWHLHVAGQLDDFDLCDFTYELCWSCQQVEGLCPQPEPQLHSRPATLGQPLLRCHL